MNVLTTDLDWCSVCGKAHKEADFVRMGGTYKFFCKEGKDFVSFLVEIPNPIRPIAIKASSIKKLGSSHPTHWEAETTDGKYVYIRFRHGRFSIEIAHTIIVLSYPDSFDRESLTWEDVLQLGHFDIV